MEKENEKQYYPLKRKLDTKESCFLCLSLIDFKIEIGWNPTQERAIKQPLKVQFKNLHRYLEIDIKKLLQSSSSIPFNKINSSQHFKLEDAEVDLCRTCSNILNKASGLAKTLEKIQMEMHYWLERIHQQISKASEKPEVVQNYSQRMTSDPETLAQLAFVDALRNEISKSVKQKRFLPEANVVLHRLDSNSAPLQIPPEQILDFPSSEDELQIEHIIKLEYDLQSRNQFTTDALEHESRDQLNHLTPSTPATFSKPSSEARSVYNSKSGKHKCAECQKEFRTSSGAVAHYNFVHLQKTWKCDICNKVLLKLGYFKCHMKLCRNSLRQQDPRYQFPCPICERKFLQRSHLKQHIKINHLKKKKPSCELCNKSFASFGNMNNHKNVVHLGKRFKCKSCIKEFKYSQDLLRHNKICGNRENTREPPVNQYRRR